MKKSLLTIAVFALLFLALPVFAVPLLINFQGKLTDLNQAPIDGLADIAFSIYDAQTSGNLLWSEINIDVTVTNGIFNVLIGSGAPGPSNTGDLSTVFTGEDRWLEVQVGADPPMTPRQRVVSVAYSIHSGSAPWSGITGMPGGFADGVDNEGITSETDPTVPASIKDGISWNEISNRPPGLDDGDDVGGSSLWQQSGSNIYYNNGRVGIGISNPDNKVHVFGGNNDGIKIEVPDGRITNAQLILSVGNEPQYGQGAIVQLNGPSSYIDPNALLLFNRTNGPLVFATNNRERMRIRSDGALILYGPVYRQSDVKLKKNIQTIPDALKKVLQLRGVNFDWKQENSYENIDLPKDRQLGLIAQEVEEVIPENVFTNEKGFKSVEYSNLVALLIEAIKEQQNEIVNIKKLIEDLESN